MSSPSFESINIPDCIPEDGAFGQKLLFFSSRIIRRLLFYATTRFCSVFELRLVESIGCCPSGLEVRVPP